MFLARLQTWVVFQPQWYYKKDLKKENRGIYTMLHRLGSISESLTTTASSNLADP